MTRLFFRPRRSGGKPRPETPRDSKQQRVWTLENGKLTAVPITVGVTDGVNTEVLDGAVHPDMPLVVDTKSIGA